MIMLMLLLRNLNQKNLKKNYLHYIKNKTFKKNLNKESNDKIKKKSTQKKFKND